MKYVNIFFMMLFVSTVAFAQTLTPKFGVEAGESLKKVDQMLMSNTLVPSTYMGVYANIPLKSKRFYAKFGAGLNLALASRVERYTNYDGYGYGYGYGGYDYGYGFNSPIMIIRTENSILPTMSISAELRYNLLPVAQSWGNLFITLPVTLESAPIGKWRITRSELRIIPSIGYRYEFNKRWNIEANVGLLGYGKYFNDNSNSSTRTSTVEYTAGLRLGYTF